MAKELNKVEDKEGKLNALKNALGAIEKQFGKGAIMRFSDEESMPEIDFISTGSLKVDAITGGGLPRGRIVEIYGPESSGKTTLCLSAIAEAQKLGLQCAFIDAEHALDVVYAQKLGVDVPNLLISQPDYGEQALEITDSLVASGAVDVVVIDSVAALTPKAEIEGEMGDSHMGLQARMMSQGLRKLTALAKKNNVLLIFINQIRHKIGVMFGCVHGETLLNFVDGPSLPMREVVEKQVKGKVWSFNEVTKVYEPKDIIDWHHNSFVEKNSEYIHIQTQSIEGHGRFDLTVTPNHKVYTDSGEKEARHLTMGDLLQSKYEQQVNGTLADFLWGTMIGDTHIALRDKSTAAIKLQDFKNPEYVEWKINKLKPFFTFKAIPVKKLTKFTSDYSTELAVIKKELEDRNPLSMLINHYSPMGLALWFMDDGSSDLTKSHCRGKISIDRLKGAHTALTDIAKAFETQTGILPLIDQQSGGLIFNKEEFIKLCEIIHKYIPECMQYKLPVEFRNKYKDFSLTAEKKTAIIYVPITEIRFASPRQMRMKDKYDISVADNHNYIVGGEHNGVLIHNSPETTTGGNALKFYASMRLDIRRIGSVKKGEDAVGNEVKVKTIKNKVYPPFKEAITEITFGEGFNLMGEVIDLAVEQGIVSKSGAWYAYNDQKIGQGKDNSCTYLKENPAILNEIKDKLKK